MMIPEWFEYRPEDCQEGYIMGLITANGHVCRRCGGALYQGDNAVYDEEGQRVLCARCGRRLKDGKEADR